MRRNQEPLTYIGKDKDGNFIFRKTTISELIIEASGLNILSKIFDKSNCLYIAWIDKFSYEKIK